MQKGQMSWSKSATSCLVTPMHPRNHPSHWSHWTINRPSSGRQQKQCCHVQLPGCYGTAWGLPAWGLPRGPPKAVPSSPDFLQRTLWSSKRNRFRWMWKFFTIGLARNNSPSSGAPSPSSQAKRKTKSAFRGWHRPSSSGCSQLNLVPPQWPPDPNPARTRTRRIMIPLK